MPYDPLTQARADRAADIEALAVMSDSELRYLAEAHTLPDPLTDGLECDVEERNGGSLLSSESDYDPSSGDDGTSSRPAGLGGR